MKNDIIKTIPSYEGIGVYSLINDNSGKMYIGSSSNVKKRILQHNTAFRKQKCSSAFLDDIKQGDTFTAEILENYLMA